MAQFNSTTFGKISGKHGTAVAVIKNGKNYLRVHSKPSNPRTERQVAQRAKFAYSVKEIARFNPIFNETCKSNESRSALRSHAFRNAVKGEYPNYEMDWPNLKLATGSIPNEEVIAQELTVDGMKLEWQFLNSAGTSENDVVNVVAYEPTSKTLTHVTDVALRGDKTVMVDLPENMLEQIVEIWVYFTNGNKMSGTSHALRI